VELRFVSLSFNIRQCGAIGGVPRRREHFFHELSAGVPQFTAGMRKFHLRTGERTNVNFNFGCQWRNSAGTKSAPRREIFKLRRRVAKNMSHKIQCDGKALAQSTDRAYAGAWGGVRKIPAKRRFGLHCRAMS
jgi:hypothetical protein